MQALTIIKPLSVNTDTNELLLKADEARYLKNYRIAFNQNATGTNGGNFGVGTPLQSNVKAPALLLPAGYNKTVGAFEAEEVNKIFYWNYNSNGLHGLYMIDGNTLTPSLVLLDRTLNLSADPAHFIAAHRVSVKVVYDVDPNNAANRRIREIHLTWTEASNWQRWVNVLAAVATDGFDAQRYPYWGVRAPHFDRQALIDHATRPPMYCPQVAVVDPTDADKGKHNLLLKKVLYFAYQGLYTDGRATHLSPWSAPFSMNTQGCNINATNLPRCLELTLDGGNPLIERYRIFVKNGELGDWYLYETINRFDEPATDTYWLRQNSWKKYGYDPVTHTLKYRYCGDRESSLFSQEDALTYSTQLPIRSVAQTAAGDAILYGDNLYEYDNFSHEITDKFKLAIDKPQASGSCQPKMVNLKLYSFMGRNCQTPNFAYKKTTASKEVFFGGHSWFPIVTPLTEQLTYVDYESDFFGLTFGEKEGFMMYLAGTPYYAIGKQYKVDTNGNKEYVGVIDWSRQDQKDMVRDTFKAGGYFIMQYEFNVPAGKYIARLARHNATENDDYQRTSTYVMGLADHTKKRANLPYIGVAEIVTPTKEVAIDACTSNLDKWGSGDDLFYVAVPWDFHEDDIFGIENRRWRFIEGYVYEDDKDKVAYELLNYYTDLGQENIWNGKLTDHNGFYFAFASRGQAKRMKVIFYGQWNCGNGTKEIARNKDLPDKERGYYPNQLIYIKEANNNTFGACNRIVIRGKITDCKSGLGLSGVAVTLTRGMTTYTGSDGSWELYAHNDHQTNDKIFYNVSGLCFFSGCQCDCIDDEDYTPSLVQCQDCNERIYPIVYARQFKVQMQNQKALKGGGRYGIVAVGHDLAGRPTYGNLIDYVDYPTFMDTKTYQPSTLRWFNTVQPVFPADIKWLSFFRTKNLNFQSYLQWVGDKIEFLNNDGKVINNGVAGAVRARIYIQSLNEFNQQHNFATTANYQFVDGDLIRFYDDSENNLFDPTQTNGYMDYQILGTNWGQADTTTGTGNTSDDTLDGKSFIIPFDSRLLKLKEKKGFWIELMRPKDYNEKERFFEICGTYPVVNGKLQVMNGRLDTWDTYYQTRFFRIPDADGKTFLHPFESAAVSDFWGANADSGGRVNVRDEKAEQRWYPDDVIKSDDFVNEGRVNGLGTWRKKNRKQFKGQSWGGIVGMRAERNIIAFVCENDWFLTDYQMNLVRVTKDGLITATLEADLGNPHQKVGSNYGCAMEHTGTLVFEDGLGIWGCTGEKGVIVMDFQKAENIAAAENQSYFLNKWTFVEQFNNSLRVTDRLAHLFDVVAGYDPKRKDYLITFRPRRNNSLDVHSFINDLREVNYGMQETFVFNLEQKKWVCWTGFAPEAYGILRNSISGQELVAFAKGEPYFHNSAGVNTFNTFFGVPTQQVIDVVVNNEPMKVKVYQSVAIESDKIKYFIDKAGTEEANSFSYVPPAYLKRKENVWYAELLRDMNSYPSLLPKDAFRIMLFDGKRLFGHWLRLRLVRDLTQLNQYNEFNGVSVRLIGSEKSNK